MTAVHDAYGAALKGLEEQDLRIVGLKVNVASSMKSGAFGDAPPEWYFGMGVSELSMVFIAAGLARTGFVPLINTFVVFLTTRGVDPIQSPIAYDRLSVKLCGVYCGLSDSYDETSHQAIIDMTFVGSIPSMTVIFMVDGPEIRKAVFAITEYQGPVYLRLNYAPAPVFYGDDMRFEIGKGTHVREGFDAVIIVTGALLHNVIRVVAILEAGGIRAAVVGMHTVKPIDQSPTLECTGQTGAIAITEEHSIYGGLGNAVAEVLAECCPAPMERIGAVDFVEPEDYGQLMEKYGYGPESIALRCRAVIGRRQDDET